MQKITPPGYGRTYGAGILTCVTDGRGAEQAYELAGALKRACLAAMFALAAREGDRSASQGYLRSTAGSQLGHG
jgi:hypothetical protein